MRYRSAALILLVSVLVSALVLGGRSAAAQTQFFTRNLSVGSFGPDVLELQRILNADPLTQVAYSGTGSPGQETAYFGALTKDAVIRFQERYRADILAPSGLSAGTGLVGPATRSKLDAIKNQQIKPVSSGNSPVSTAIVPPQQVSSVPVLPMPISPAPTYASTSASLASTNPNLKNVDVFFANIDRIAAKKNISQSVVNKIKAQALKDLATTTNYRAAFDNILKRKQLSLESGPLFWKGIVENSIGSIMAFLRPGTAEAQGASGAGASEDSPFGGALLFPFYCGCSENWILTIEPLPPDYPALLTYEPFSEVYANYNIPETEWLLGHYSPQETESCEEYVPPYECVQIPSDGMITPQVGSSLY